MKRFILRNLLLQNVFILAVCLLANSCNKLDLDPQGSLSDEDVMSTPANMESALIAVYNALGEQHGNAQGENFFASPTNWQYDVVSDDAYKGSNTGDQGPLLELEEFKHNASNLYLDRKWKVLYDGVVRANNFIRLASLSTAISDQRKKTMIAEARFLRAHFYFQLYRTFRKVPYMDEKTDNATPPNDVDIMSKIIEDFQFSKSNLPISQTELGRVSQYAAAAYLGKAFLYRACYNTTNYVANRNPNGSDFSPSSLTDFTNAKNEFDFVVNSGVYSLMPEFRDVYDPTKKGQNKEVIFAVQNSVNDGAPAGEHGDLGSMLNGILGGPGGQDKNGCCGFYVPSENLVNSYKTNNGLPIDGFTGNPENGFNDDQLSGGKISDFGVGSDAPFNLYVGDLDPRLDYTIGRRGIPFLDYGLHPGATWSRSPIDQGNYSRKKRFISKEWFNSGYGVVPTNFTFTSIDFHIIRYDDVLLMLAECEVELNRYSRAQELVDMVRTRAKNSTPLKSAGVNAANYKIELYGTGNAIFTDQQKARNAVRFERRLELALEGGRFFDLVRWGIAERVINKYKEGEPVSYSNNINFVSNKNEFYPIPQNQIDLSRKEGKQTLTQNTGY